MNQKRKKEISILIKNSTLYLELKKNEFNSNK